MLHFVYVLIVLAAFAAGVFTAAFTRRSVKSEADKIASFARKEFKKL